MAGNQNFVGSFRFTSVLFWACFTRISTVFRYTFAPCDVVMTRKISSHHQLSSSCRCVCSRERLKRPNVWIIKSETRNRGRHISSIDRSIKIVRQLEQIFEPYRTIFKAEVKKSLQRPGQALRVPES